jgi:hypothetical protein
VIVTDHLEKLPAYQSAAKEWLRDCRLRLRETVVDGLERMPDALLGLYRGDNLGKMVVRLDRTYTFGVGPQKSTVGPTSRSVTGRATMARMQGNGNPASASIVITLDLEAEPIHGFVDDGSAASIEFTGWLDLMSVITKLRVRTTDDREPR